MDGLRQAIRYEISEKKNEGNDRNLLLSGWWRYHMDTNETYGEKASWSLQKNSTCFFE